MMVQQPTLEPLRRWDPDRIGPYVLLGRLGAGAMGQVYLGRSTAGRLVAVKTIKIELAEEPGFRDHFAHEVAAARRVSGLFTAAVVAADPEADVPWLATAYLPAPSLSRLVRVCGPQPVETIWWLAAGCAEALESIHGAGLVHRDLKPSNVLVAADGPRVIDFGVARAAERIQLTVTQGAVGTPAYMAPEQARDTRQASMASDVFSLGATLLFAATGHAPYQGETVMDILVRLATEPPDLSGLPDELTELITACLQRSPRDRPTSAAVLRRLGPLMDRPAGLDGEHSYLTERAMALIGEYQRSPQLDGRAAPPGYSSQPGDSQPGGPSQPSGPSGPSLTSAPSQPSRPGEASDPSHPGDASRGSAGQDGAIPEEGATYASDLALPGAAAAAASAASAATARRGWARLRGRRADGPSGQRRPGSAGPGGRAPSRPPAGQKRRGWPPRRRPGALPPAPPGDGWPKPQRRHEATFPLAGRAMAAVLLVAAGAGLGILLRQPASTVGTAGGTGASRAGSSTSGLAKAGASTHSPSALPGPAPFPSSFHGTRRPTVAMFQDHGDGNTEFVVHGFGWLRTDSVTVTVAGDGSARETVPVDRAGTFNCLIGHDPVFFTGRIPLGWYRVIVTGPEGKHAAARFHVIQGPPPPGSGLPGSGPQAAGQIPAAS
jgi:serine/threonine protein kinase